MEKRVVIIDTDIILFRDAAVMEKRTVNVKHIPSGREKVFDTRTTFKDSLKARNFEYKKQDYLITDLQETKGPFSVVESLIDNHIKKISEFCWADEVALYIGDEGATFRENLPLPSKYKGNRTEMIAPIYLAQAKHYVRTRHKAISHPGIESDDSITIRAYEELEKGNIPIIATIDKDAYQSQGVQILNIMTEPWSITEVPEIGHVEKVAVNTAKGTGLMFLAYQLLFGDPVDKYKPSEASQLTYGMEKVLKALSGLSTGKEILEKVISEYKRLYPEEFVYVAWNGLEVGANWKSMLNMYWKCAYMKRSMTDQSNFWEFAARYGLDEKDY